MDNVFLGVGGVVAISEKKNSYMVRTTGKKTVQGEP